MSWAARTAREWPGSGCSLRNYSDPALLVALQDTAVISLHYPYLVQSLVQVFLDL